MLFTNVYIGYDSNSYFRVYDNNIDSVKTFDILSF